MVKIKNNKITITKGDTLETHLIIKMSSGEEYVPAEGDTIRFALPIITGKTIMLGQTNYLKLTPEEIAIVTNKGWNVAA